MPHGKTLLLLLSLLCFVVRLLLALFGGSSGRLDLDALGMALLVWALL